MLFEPDPSQSNFFFIPKKPGLGSSAHEQKKACVLVACRQSQKRLAAQHDPDKSQKTCLGRTNFHGKRRKEIERITMMQSEDQRKAQQHAAYTAVMNSRANNDMNQTKRDNHEEQCQAPKQPSQEQKEVQPQPQPQPQQVSRPRGLSSSSGNNEQSVSNYPPQNMNQLPPWIFPNNQNIPVPFANIMTAPKFTWRKGKWSEEEELYTKKLIDAFNSGCLKIASGTTLRSFLAERLFWYVLLVCM